MASSAILIKGSSDLADVVVAGGDSLSLAFNTPKGAVYKLATRDLTTPLSMEFDFQIGAPGSKGNDRLIIRSSNSKLVTGTDVVTSCVAKLEVSVPRIGAWTKTEVANVISYLTSSIGLQATRSAIAAAMVP